jgi:hypothetical protein
MADIFTDEELKAAEQTTVEPVETPAEEQSQEGQPRDPETGKFLPKDPAPEGEPEAEPRGENKVPQGALHAERERRKTAETELKKAQEQLQALAALREQVKARQPDPVQPPETDDTGLKHLTERLNQVEQTAHKATQTLDMQRIEEAENQQIAAVVAQSEAAYRTQKPDYDDAIRHVVNARAHELELYGLSPVEIRTALGNEVADIARSAIAQGRDPAELGYQIALSRGYRPGSGEAQPGQGQRTVDAVAAARSQSRSLGQAAGSTPTQLTAEAILAMPSEEFEALYMTPEGRKLIDSIGGAA